MFQEKWRWPRLGRGTGRAARRSGFVDGRLSAAMEVWPVETSGAASTSATHEPLPPACTGLRRCQGATSSKGSGRSA